jgi:hypothetical protein
VRRGDQYAKLAVTQPRDEPARLADSHAVAGAVALSGLGRKSFGS